MAELIASFFGGLLVGVMLGAGIMGLSRPRRSSHLAVVPQQSTKNSLVFEGTMAEARVQFKAFRERFLLSCSPNALIEVRCEMQYGSWWTNLAGQVIDGRWSKHVSNPEEAFDQVYALLQHNTYQLAFRLVVEARVIRGEPLVPIEVQPEFRAAITEVDNVIRMPTKSPR